MEAAYDWSSTFSPQSQLYLLCCNLILSFPDDVVDGQKLGFEFSKGSSGPHLNLINWIYPDVAIQDKIKLQTPDSLVKKWYLQNISWIGVDSFLYLWPNYNHECLPPTESIDLVSYLVYFQLTNYYTKERFKALKILQQQDFITRLKIKLRITA